MSGLSESSEVVEEEALSAGRLESLEIAEGGEVRSTEGKEAARKRRREEAEGN